MLPLPQLATASVDFGQKLLAVLDAEDGARHSSTRENPLLVRGIMGLGVAREVWLSVAKCSSGSVALLLEASTGTQPGAL